MKHWDETTKCRVLRTGGVGTAPKALEGGWFPVLTPGSGQVPLYLWAMYKGDVRSPLTCCTPAKHTAFPPVFSLLSAINGSVMWHQLFLTLSNVACGSVCKKKRSDEMPWKQNKCYQVAAVLENVTAHLHSQRNCRSGTLKSHHRKCL